MNEEAYPEAAAVLRDAGWKQHDTWHVYTRGTLVMGLSPDGQYFDVKNWGLDIHGPDYPDDPVEAALWLVNLRKAPVDLSDEASETPVHESDSEIGEALSAQASATASAVEPDPTDELEPAAANAAAAADLEDGDGVLEPSGTFEPEQPIDADFTESADLGAELLDVESELAGSGELEGPPPEDFAPDEITPDEPGSGAFIFGDNLHQLRTAAIGLVVQSALTRLPEAMDYAKLSELRNFAMGVSEGRWPDDPARRDELDLLEATERRRRAIETERDAKVAFLVDATRPQVEAFDPEAGWP